MRAQPLLSLRPTRDLKSTLLHEMIHAWIMVNRLQRQDGDPSGHGRVFHAKAAEINVSSVEDPHRPLRGYAVTQYHSMIDEVEHYRQHHWRCEKCGNEVRRAMNRAPQPADCRHRVGQVGCRDPNCRYCSHRRVCGGSYIKVKEPQKPPKKVRKIAGSSNNEMKGTRDDSAMGCGLDNESEDHGLAEAIATTARGKGSMTTSERHRPITDFFDSMRRGRERMASDPSPSSNNDVLRGSSSSSHAAGARASSSSSGRDTSSEYLNWKDFWLSKRKNNACHGAGTAAKDLVRGRGGGSTEINAGGDNIKVQLIEHAILRRQHWSLSQDRHDLVRRTNTAEENRTERAIKAMNEDGKMLENVSVGEGGGSGRCQIVDMLDDQHQCEGFDVVDLSYLKNCESGKTSTIAVEEEEKEEDEREEDRALPSRGNVSIACPVCGLRFEGNAYQDLNEHLDRCLVT